MKKFTKEQKEKALKKLAKKYAQWNVILKENDEETRGKRTHQKPKDKKCYTGVIGDFSAKPKLIKI